MSDGMDYGQSERSMWFAELAALRADLAKAREERDEHFAARVKAGHRHDEDLRIIDGERRRALAAERARDEAVKAYRRAADALGWAREIGADEVAQYAALAPEETALDDTGREEFRAGVLAAANYLVSISVPGHISAQFILDLAAGIRALPTPVVEDDECGFCLRPMRERNTKCLLCSPPAPSVEEGPRPKCSGCGQEIDPDVCGCGSSRQGHGWGDGHSFIPMGCDCMRVRPAPSPEAPALGRTDGEGT